MSTKIYKINSNLAKYTDEEFSAIETLLATEGVFDISGTDQDFEVTESSPAAMTVDVAVGTALVEYLKSSITWKVVVNSNAVETLSVSANSSGNNRVDAVVIHLKQDEPNALKNNVAELKVMLGDGVASLSDADLNTALGDTNWYRLADITVPDGTLDIENGDITDTRERVTLDALPTDGATNYVELTGNQTVAGIKTFSSFPVTPSAAPTTNYQVPNKKYVDDTFLTPTHLTTTGIAYESIAEDDAICELPVQVEYYAHLDAEGAGKDIAIGDSNVRRKYSIKFRATKNVATVPNYYFETRKVANGMSMVVRVETDNAGESSGNLVHANATATLGIPGAVTYANDLATWAGAFSLVKGTVYHFVIQVAATDAVNYNEIAVNSDFDENYLTFERQTFDLDAGTWGGAVTNATPYFWSQTTENALGTGLAVCDANFGGRTWSFVGFASATASLGDSLVYYHDTVPGLSDLANGKGYYISETAGEISFTNPGSRYGGGKFSYSIGKAQMNSSGEIIFKINKGEKYVWGTYSGTNATVTEFPVLWFKPKVIEVSQGNVETATTHDSSNGVYDGTSNYSAYLHQDDGGGESAGVSTTKCGYPDTVGGAIYGIGFVMTTTRGGGETGFGILWKAKA